MISTLEHRVGVSHHKRDYGITFVKRMGVIDRIYRCNSIPHKGYEIGSRITGKNSEKLDNNLSRARSAIREYALCNEWKYFVTLTIDQSKFDRYNLTLYKKSLGKFLNNWNSRHSEKVTYLLVPEFHKDGAIHMHGLMNGLDGYLHKNENSYLDWQAYKDRFGYISLDPVRDNIKVAHYITKYITKELSAHSDELGKHLYIHSQGLSKGEVIYKSECEITCYDFENDYCKIKEIDNRTDNYMFYLDL